MLFFTIGFVLATIFWGLLIWFVVRDREEDRTLGAIRSPHWPKVRKEHLKKFPTCAVCGSTETLEVHHIKMFNEHPELELDPNNLLTLCESNKKGIICHRAIGHLGNYRLINPKVKETALFLNKILN